MNAEGIPTIHEQIESLKRYRQYATGKLANYLDGAIAALTWAHEPSEYISLAATLCMGIDPTAERPARPKLEVVRG